MHCSQISDDELAERYVSGQLDATVQDEFEVHLLECSQCQGVVTGLVSLRRVLVEQEEEIRRASSRPRRRFALAWTLAAFLVMAGIAALLVGRSRDHQQPKKAASQPAPIAPSSPTPTASTATPAAEEHKSPSAIAHKEQQGKTAESPQAETSTAASNAPPQKDDAGSTVAKTDHKPAKSPAEPLREETAVELYKVGMVEPPAYTFAGFGATTKREHSQGQSNGAVSPGVSTPGVRVLFQQAMAAYVQGDYENAGAVLEDALRVEPDSMDVNFYLGICRIVNGHPAEAVVPLKKVLTGPTSSLTQSAHFYLAKAYVQMQKLDGAEDEMRAAAHMAGRLSSAAQALVPRIQNLRTALAQRQVKPSD